MVSNNVSPRELWAKQQICNQDVDYDLWNMKRKTIQEMSRISHECIFTVDVFRERYDFASQNFASIFGYNPSYIQTIQNQGDLLEERIHPDDRVQIAEYQVEHGQFIYSLPLEERNEYQQIFQYRVLNAKRQYVNVVSRQQVIQKDRNGKAWIIMGVMDVSPDQILSEKVKRSVINRRTGELIASGASHPSINLITAREKEVLLMIRQGLLSKEIADRLHISIYTVNNHRKNILTKLKANNAMEAIHIAQELGLLF